MDDLTPGQSLVFGRGPGADVEVKDPYCSPRHCRITQDAAGCFWVEDLGSTNGTRIVRPGLTVRVELGLRVELRPGELVAIGRTVLPWEAP